MWVYEPVVRSILSAKSMRGTESQYLHAKKTESGIEKLALVVKIIQQDIKYFI